MAERAQPTRPAPQWAAFFELGFRPLYLAGCFWAAFSMALWVFAPGLLHGQLGTVFWHAHEMLWGFIATIAVGFLLTAGSNWTGINPLKGGALGALGMLWAAARVGFLIPGPAAFWLATVFELLFFAGSSAALARVIWRSRNRRNYGVPFLVLALGAIDALYLTAAWRGDYAMLMQHFNTGLLCMAVVTLLVARRVIPFFAMRAVPGLAIPMHTRSGHWQLAAALLGMACGLLGWTQAMAAFLMVAGAIALAQVLAWKPWAVRRAPLLWVLYLGYAALGVGLLVAAAQVCGGIARLAWPAHVIGVAGFSVLVIGMVTRTSMGHLGQPLKSDRPLVACYALLIAAATLRLVALLPTVMATGALHASALAWVAAFALYLWRFFPLMIRPRIDQWPSRQELQAGKIPVRPRASR